MTRVTAEVGVIGGGPAGSVFATRMAQLGFDVCLVERSRFPRPHLGESLSPGVMPMLASIGAAAAVEAAGFWRVHQITTNWDGAETVRRDPRAEGLLVDRAVFDTALLARARSAGVRVLQPARARAPVRTPDGWRLRVEAPETSLTLDAAFLADGSGRAACLGGPRRATGPRTVALHGYWTGGRLSGQPRIEAGARGWCWGVPIPDGSYNTLVFMDVARFRAERGAGTLDDRLRELLGPSTLMREVRGAALRGPTRAADATPYVHEDCVGQRHIRIGDAALALDPLSSSGVQKAIQTALAGAIVANTLLRKPADGDAALRFYRGSIGEAASRHRAWATGHYATAAACRPDSFWSARADGPGPHAPDGAPVLRDDLPAVVRDAPGDDVPVRLSADCRWEDVPCLGAHFVELKPALRHRGLDGPLAYLGGHQLAPLLRHVPAGMTLRELSQAWSGSTAIGTGLSIARWLSERGILERCAGGGRGP